MSTSSNNFKQSYINTINHKNFQVITGLPVKGNEAAYIGYLNFLAADLIYEGITKVYSELPLKRGI